MKYLLAASFGALLLSGAVAAHAAPASTQANAGVAVAQATFMPPAAGNNRAKATAVYLSHGAVPVNAGIGVSRTNGINPWDVNLVTQTGGGR